MPIRREHRFFYPIDWRELPAVTRFGRAKGHCEGCGRPHGQMVFHLGDGRWWDAEEGAWRDGHGQPLTTPPMPEELPTRLRTTRVVLATAHRNHDTADNRPANLAAWCQRCHMIHDRPEHIRRRWLTVCGGRRLVTCFAVPTHRYDHKRAHLVGVSYVIDPAERPEAGRYRHA